MTEVISATTRATQLHELVTLVTARHRNAWAIADWLVEHVPNNGAGKSLSPGVLTLAECATETGLSISWLKDSRLAAELFPPGHRIDHAGVSTHLELYRKTGSPATVVASLRANPRLRDVRPEKDVVVAVQALSDPELRTSVLAKLEPEDRVEVLKDVAEDAVGNMFDPKVGPAFAVIAEVSNRQREVQEKRTRQMDEHPVIRKIDGMRALMDLDDALSKCTQEIKYLLPLCAIPAEGVMADDYFLRLQIKNLREMLDAVERFVDTGRTDVDAFVADVLQGGR